MKHTVFLVNPQPTNGDFVYLIAHASAVVKFVLLLLVMFSVISWAVIIFKNLEYSRARKNAERFRDFFRKSKNYSEIHKATSLYGNNPLGEIFKQGYREISLQLGAAAAAPPSGVNIDSLHRALLRGSNAEISRLERFNSFLATTATVTPFIGLFGTVWGIMTSFQAIGVQMNANLATVAPGIAEALVTTAMGLFAAIPEVIFYNQLLSKLKRLIATMDDFILDFLNLSEKLQ